MFQRTCVVFSCGSSLRLALLPFLRSALIPTLLRVLQRKVDQRQWFRIPNTILGMPSDSMNFWCRFLFGFRV
jgi:hypothetical protein